MSLVVTLFYDSEFATSTTTLKLILEKLRVYLFSLIGEVRRLRTFASKCSYVDITLRLCTYFISCKNLPLEE